MATKNAISWFEIPTQDLNRAQRFYEAILDIRLTPLDLENIQMRIFPVEDDTSPGGALVNNTEFYAISSSHGVLVYLNANPDVQQVLDRIEPNGGKVLIPKTEISPEYGYMAVILDTEGNRIAFHSNR